MKLLLKAGADVNQGDALGIHALEFAAGNPKLNTQVKMLIDAGADVNTLTKSRNFYA